MPNGWRPISYVLISSARMNVHQTLYSSGVMAVPARRVESAAPIEHDRAFFGHPRGLSTLFFTEMWERFSYYGMRALLILFMTAPLAGGGLAFDIPTAGVVYGLFTAMVYLAAMPGGWLADRIIGRRYAFVAGGVVIGTDHCDRSIP